jgi:hypothetical protein
MAQRPRQTRLKFESQFRPTSIDTSGAEAMRQLAGLGRTMGQVTEQIGRPIREQEMAEKGREEAKKAFEEGREVEAPTAYAWGASQYSAAAARQTAELEREKEKADFEANKAYESQQRIDTTRAVNEAILEYENDPEGFEAWAKTYEEGVVSKIQDPLLAQSVREFIFDKTFPHQAKLQSAYNAKKEKEHIGVYQDEFDEAYAEAERLLVDGDLIGAGISLDDAIRTQYDIQRLDPDHDAEGFIEAARRKFNALQLRTEVSNIADTNSFEDAYRRLEEAAGQVPDNFTVDQWDLAVEEAKQKLVLKKGIADSAEAATTQEDQLFFNSYIQVLENGGTPSQADDVRAGRIMANDFTMQKQYETAQQVATFSSMSAENRMQVLNGLDPNLPENQVLISAYATQELNIRNALAKDAWAFAAQQGVMTEDEQQEFAQFDVANMLTQDLSAEDQAAMRAAYARNEEIARRLSIHYGYTFSPLNNQQVAMLTNALPEMTPGEKIELVNAIGPKTKKVWEQFVEEGAGLFAVAATLKDVTKQRAIFKGQQRIESETTDKFKDSGDMMYDALYDVVGDTLGDKEREQTYEAAKALYASTFVGENYVYNEDNFKDAIMQITGEVGNVRGFKTIAPSYSRGNNEGTLNNLEDYFDEMTFDEFIAAGGVPMPYTTTKTVGSGGYGVRTRTIEVTGDRNFDRLKSSEYRIKATHGDNNYMITAADGQTLVDTNGNTLVFNVSEEAMRNFLGRKQAAKMEAADRTMRLDPTFIRASETAEYNRQQRAENASQGMFRPDGSIKSEVGFLGPIKADDGSTMTEYSVGVELEGEQIDIPTLVPTLTDDEIDILKGAPDPSDIPESIMRKAVDHARKRIAAGLDPFYQDGN